MSGSIEGEFSSSHINNAQLELRVAIAQWEQAKLTVYASTQGIANCRTDIAKDLGVPLESNCACEDRGFPSAWRSMTLAPVAEPAISTMLDLAVWNIGAEDLRHVDSPTVVVPSTVVHSTRPDPLDLDATLGILDGVFVG